MLRRAQKPQRDRSKEPNLHQYTRISKSHLRWQRHRWVWTLLTATIRQDALRGARNKGSPDGSPTCPSRQGSQETVRHMERREIMSEPEKHVQEHHMIVIM